MKHIRCLQKCFELQQKNSVTIIKQNQGKVRLLFENTDNNWITT